MAQSGGNRKNSSKLQKIHYQNYKLQNRAEKNKIKKLERHCKKHPEDVEGKKNLERIKKDGYTPRSKPLVPGSNQNTVSLKPQVRAGYIHYPETPGEQLSRLLGIPLPKQSKSRHRGKASVTYKKRRNVKKS